MLHFSLVILVLLLAACGPSQDDTTSRLPTATARAVIDSRTPQPTLPPPPYREPSGPIDASNAQGLAYLGRLDATGAPSSIFSYAFALDGSRLAALNNNSLLVWSLVDGRLSLNVPRNQAVRVYYASDLEEVYTVTERGEVVIRDPDTGREVNRFFSDIQYNNVAAYDAERDLLALAGRSGLVQVWDAAERTARARLEAHRGPINALAFSNDGARLASAGVDGIVRIWDWSARQQMAQFDLKDGGVGALAFSPDGQQVVVGTSQYIAVWNVADSSLRYSLAVGFGGSADVLRYSPDGRSIITGGYEADMLLVSADDGQVIAQLPDVRGERVSATFSLDGSLLATSTLDGQARLWNLSSLTAETIASAPLDVAAQRLTDVTISPDGFLLAFFDANGSVLLWGLPGG
ncbi:MAG: WD40 repeat domain-containing protein [Anaerolineae bacterium]|nr:WD40 repeat domain-containing protein [Anaerolineae bacterium]MDW8172287.1 WD40 repeat domain-containing protein [Anaerolineae bacterium]